MPHTAGLPLKHEIEIIDGYILTPRGQRATVNCMYTGGHLVAVQNHMSLLKQYTYTKMFISMKYLSIFCIYTVMDKLVGA